MGGIATVEQDLFDLEEITEINRRIQNEYSFEKRQLIDEIHALNNPEKKTAEDLNIRIISYQQDNLFDLDEITRVNEDLRQAEHDKLNREAREKLELLHYENPKNENELMMNYQYEYLKNGSIEAWGKLIVLVNKVCKKLVYGWLARKKQFYLDDLAVEERASVAAEYVLRRYSKNIGYCVTKNYIHTLKLGVTHAMQYITTLDKETVYLDDVKEEYEGYEQTEQGI